MEPGSILLLLFSPPSSFNFMFSCTWNGVQFQTDDISSEPCRGFIGIFFICISVVTDSCKMPKYWNSFFSYCYRTESVVSLLLANMKYIAYKVRMLMLRNSFAHNSSPAKLFTHVSSIWDLNVSAQSLSLSVCLVLALFLALARRVSSCLMGSVWWLCWAFRKLAAQRDSGMSLAQQGIDFDILSVTTTSLLHGCQQRWH